jgi:hypothetical protein
MTISSDSGRLTTHYNPGQSCKQCQRASYICLGRDWNILGLLSIGAHSEMIIREPLNMPEAPAPATTRPPINIFEEFATPQSKEPISKRMKKIRNVH